MNDGAGKSAWTQAVRDYLTSAASSRFRHAEVTILDQWQGRDNLLWRVRSGDGVDAVVKMFTDAGQARSRRQFSGQEQFAAAGLAPEPLWYDRYPHGLPRQILVYRWAEGEALQLTDPLHQTALAATLAQIHRGGGSAVQRFSPHPFNLLTFWQIWQAGEARLREWLAGRSAPLLTELSAQLWAAAHRMLDTALALFGETPPTPIHGDLAAENGLYRRGQVLLLDWEFFGLGDPAQEIARFLYYNGDAWPHDRQGEWLELYGSGSADPSLADRVALYLRLFSFQAVTFLLEGVRQGVAAHAQGPARGVSGSGDLPASAWATPAQEAVTADSDSDSGAADGAAQYRSFLIDALTAALRQALKMWGLPPLDKADGALLADELEHLMDFQLAELL